MSSAPPPPPQPNATDTASQASAGSRRNNGPTISIENVELLEADRQHDEKRSRRGSRQQEAEAAANGQPQQQQQQPPQPGQQAAYGGAYPGYDAAAQQQAAAAAYGQQQQAQQAQDPTAPSSYFYPNYVPAPSPGQQPPHGLAPRQQPHYGMSYQGGYQTAGSGFYSPPPQQQATYAGSTPYYSPQQQPPTPSSASASEYTGMLAGNNSLSSFGDTSGNYGSIGGGGAAAGASPGVPQPGYGANMAGMQSHHTEVTGSSNRGTGALTIDDIEKSFNAVVSQQHFDPHAPKSTTSTTASAGVVPIAPASGNDGANNALARPPAPSPSSHNKDDSSHGNSNSNNPKPSRPKASHRRSHSSASAGSAKAHRRSGSTGNLPPVGPRHSPAPSSGNRKKPDIVPRRRSLSGTFSSNNSVGGNSGGGGGVVGVPRRSSFTRNNSHSDLQSVGAQSVTSHHSIVSDISKSALFQGVTDEGHVQLHFPYEAVRLINNDAMEPGRLYMQEIHGSEYEAYHVAAEDLADFEHGLDHMPQTYYALKIDDDLYRRVLDEIAESHSMPCGMFFCGHHEDISHPSIMIAICVVALLFGAMGYIAYVTQA